jgi:hypothetical protein
MTVLMHTDDRRIDHLYRWIVGSSQHVHDPAPDTSPSPANEAVVASGVRTEVVREVAPWRSGSQYPEDAIEDAPVVYPWHAPRLVREHWLDNRPFIVGEGIAHDSSLRGGLESWTAADLNVPSTFRGLRSALALATAKPSDPFS